MKNTGKLWLAALTGGAMAVALAGVANAAPETPPGEEAGLNASAPLPEGVYFINMFGTGGDYLVDDKKSNLTFTVPALAWATPWTFFGGRLEIVGALPIIANIGLGDRDLTAVYNPFFEAGLAWNLGGGWGFSTFNGGYLPIDNELREFGHDLWTYNNRSWLGWSGNLGGGGWKDGGGGMKGTFALESVLGITGDNLDTGSIALIGKRPLPDYWNLNLTAYATYGKWDLGLVGFYSTDLENNANGMCNPGISKCEQARAGIGPLVAYNFPGITVQANYTFDVYDENYRNLDGSKMEIQQFWLKTVIPLWNPPALESLK